MAAITLRGLRVLARHGADPGEREREQPFDLELAVDYDSSAAERSDDLADALDYAELSDRVVKLVESTSFALLERLAAAVLDAVFEDARVRSATIAIAKPGILGGATPAVTLSRIRGSS